MFRRTTGGSIRFAFLPTTLPESDSTFNKSELIEIQGIFQNVAEDFLPLDVNVTTRYPGVEGLKRSSASDNEYGIRVVVTQQSGSFGARTGGLAKRNSFVDSRDTPAFVFNKGVNNAAWTISHEAGHTLGLTHDGLNGKDYHPGVGSGPTSWGPIMGGAFGKSLTQWSDGSYVGANNHQDDLSVMTRAATGIQLRNDDVGNSRGSADLLKRTGDRFSDWGTITSRADVDFYKFSVEDSEVTLSVKPFQGQGNLDVVAKLYSSSGELIKTSDLKSSVAATFAENLKKGTYYLAVDGAGLEGRYSDYGSLGFYSIEGLVKAQETTVDGNAIGESGTVQQVDHLWRKVQLQKSFKDPVVIGGPATSNDEAAGVVQIRNVNSNSFEIRIQNWDNSPSERLGELVSYVVVEAGKHDLPDGRRLVAGNGYLSDKFRRIGFGEHFKTPPVVLGQVISERGDTAVKTRIEGVNTGSFGTLLQKGEAHDEAHPFERFSFLAIDSSGDNATDMLASSIQKVAHDARQIQVFNQMGAAPVVLAHTQTRNDDDPGTLRMRTSAGGKLSLYYQEEKSADAEVEHHDEQLGYLMLRPGLLIAAEPQTEIKTDIDSVFGREKFELEGASSDFAALDRFLSKTNRG